MRTKVVVAVLLLTQAFTACADDGPRQFDDPGCYVQPLGLATSVYVGLFNADLTPHCVDSATIVIRQGTEGPDTMVRMDMVVGVATEDTRGVHMRERISPTGGCNLFWESRVPVPGHDATPFWHRCVETPLEYDVQVDGCPRLSGSWDWNDNYWAGLRDYNFHVPVVACAP